MGRTTDGFFRYQGWPTVVKDEKGIVYAAASGQRLAHVCPFGKDLLYISHDESESWLDPIIANDTYMDDRDAGLVAWRDGHLLLSWFAHPRDFYKEREASHPSVNFSLSKATRQEWEALSQDDHAFGSYVKRSRDGGKTWGKESIIGPEAPDWDLGYPSSVELSDGSILTVYYQKYPGDSYTSILSTHREVP